MNYTQLSGVLGAAVLGVTINLSTESAFAYSSNSAYRHHQIGYWVSGGASTRTYGAYRAPPRQIRTYGSYRTTTTYRRSASALARTPAYTRGVTTPRRFARGGGTGMATFYDPAPSGRGLTAAHLSLPMGTHVRVTNLTNRRSVVVRIADRGPEAWTGRILDLSRTAAYSLGMVAAGVVPVTYQIVN